MQAIEDGVFKAELNELLTRELAEDGYSGVTVRRTTARTDIIIRATRTQKVLGAPLLACVQCARLASAPSWPTNQWKCMLLARLVPCTGRRPLCSLNFCVLLCAGNQVDSALHCMILLCCPEGALHLHPRQAPHHPNNTLQHAIVAADFRTYAVESLLSTPA